MKTTKDIAQLFCDEIERIGRGEVRKDVIAGLEKCSAALIKLARLEMDYAWKNWDLLKPDVPWLSSSHVELTLPAIEAPKPIQEPSKSVSVRIADMMRERSAAEKELANPKTSQVMKRILEDKIQKWSDKIEFLQHTKGKVQE